MGEGVEDVLFLGHLEGFGGGDKLELILLIGGTEGRLGIRLD